MSRRVAVAAAACLMAIPLTGCGGEKPSATPDSDQVYLPSESPSPSVTMIDPPADYSTVEGEGFEISAPGEFQQSRTAGSNGEDILLFEKPSQVPAVPQRVAVIRDVAPKSSAAEQSFSLETAKAATGPAAEARRVALEAPEGQAAFLITWMESRPSEGAENVEVVYWQLMQQVSDKLILNVVAFAPAEEFESSEVSKILRTFSVTSSA